MTQDMVPVLLNRSSVILDEIDSDFKKATTIAKAAGLRALELRMAFGRNIAEISNSQLWKIKEHLKSQEMKICALASPLFKCFLPGEEGKGKPGDQFGFQAANYKTHRALVPRLIEIADFFGVNVIRCFGFWDTGPLNEARLYQLAEFIRPVGEEVGSAGKILVLENEPSTFVKTAQNASQLLSLLDLPWVRFLRVGVVRVFFFFFKQKTAYEMLM